MDKIPHQCFRGISWLEVGVRRRELDRRKGQVTVLRGNSRQEGETKSMGKRGGG